MPGRANTDSTTTAPETSDPKAHADSAIPGRAACRSRWRPNSPRRVSPRARAASAKAERCASSTPSRTVSARYPATGTASVSTGSTQPARGAVTDRRHPAQGGGEHHDEHAAEPEVRHHARGDAQGAGEPGGDPAALRRGPRGDDREHPGDDEAGDRERQRDGQLLGEERRDRGAEGVRVAELAGREASEEHRVLHQDRLVEAVLVPDLGDGLGRGLRARSAEDRERRVTGDEPDRDEDDRRDGPEHADAPGEPPDGPPDPSHPGQRSIQAVPNQGVETGVVRMPCTAERTRKWFCWSYRGSTVSLARIAFWACSYRSARSSASEVRAARSSSRSSAGSSSWARFAK